MFEINTGAADHGYKYKISHLEISRLLKQMDKRFNMKRFRKGESSIYLLKPDSKRNTYTEETRRKLSKVIHSAYEKGEISSTKIADLVFVIEYSNKKEVTSYFPFDFEALVTVDEIAEGFMNGNIIQLVGDR